MRWPWRRRDAPPRYAGTHRRATWAEPAYPPADPGAEQPVVRLGFASGDEVELTPHDPRAVALRAVAGALLGDDAAGRTPPR